MKKDIIIQDAILQKAAEEGLDAFVNVFVTAINDAIDGELTLENMEQLNADQITLLAWNILHEEVMDGGYIQLIHNGYGAFIFKIHLPLPCETGDSTICINISGRHTSYTINFMRR